MSKEDKNLSDPIRSIFAKYKNYINPNDIDDIYLDVFEKKIDETDVISFVENVINSSSEIDKDYFKFILIQMANDSILLYRKDKLIPDTKYLNALKVLKHFNGDITQQPSKLILNDSVNDKQIVYLFRILYEKYYIQSNKNEVAKVLSLIFNVKEETAKKYLSDKEIKAPESIFKVDWKEL